MLGDELADRLERALADAGYWRGAELKGVPGNPLAVDFATFGRVQARRVANDLAYYRYFSGPLMLCSEDEAVIPELIAWYAERRAPCYVRLSPLFASEALLRALGEVGLAQTGFMSVLYGSLSAIHVEPADQVTVVEVGPDTDQVFLDLWTDAAPPHERAARQQLARSEFTHWRRYLAFADVQAVAHAATFISTDNRAAVLAAAGTWPGARGRGCQTALIGRRVSDAAAAGCDLVVVEATPGSASQRNLERAGLRLAYTRVVWTFR